MSSSTISVESLQPADKEGFLTKQGGSWKNWKRRWMVLKKDTIFYFKTQKDKDVTGTIHLTKSSFVREDPKKKFCFAVGTPNRVFFMYPDSKEEQISWLRAIQEVIDDLKGIPKPGSNGDRAAGTAPTNNEPIAQNTANGNSANHLVQLRNAAKSVPFLQDPNCKPLEFWEIWSESVPPEVESFQIACALNLSQLSWRCIGPQNKLIQKMVDFFWNVGAPEAEIDRLNDVGTLINPLTIGSWIDMSAKGGMDGGWFFPSLIDLKLGLEASDSGEATKKLVEWAEANGYDQVAVVGRDMGAAPPRQTHFELLLDGSTPAAQLEQGLSAYEAFGFPFPPEDVLNVVRDSNVAGLRLSVVSSSEGFVKIGLLVPNPGEPGLHSILSSFGGDTSVLSNFEDALGVSGVNVIEFKHLQSGFGYGVYKEGYDIAFHYTIDR